MNKLLLTCLFAFCMTSGLQACVTYHGPSNTYTVGPDGSVAPKKQTKMDLSNKKKSKPSLVKKKKR